MLRTIVVRNELLRETLKKAIRINIARTLSVECTRRRHRNNEPTILKSTNKLQWKYNAIRYYANFPPHHRVLLPALSPTMETGTIVSWEKKEGDKLNEGELLCEIETDKATMGFETPEEGYLAKIVIPAGTKGVTIGKLVCIIVDNQADVAAFKDFKDDGSAPAAAPAAAPTPAAPAPAAPVHAAPAYAAAPPSPAAPSGHRVYASPMAKRLAEQRQIRLEGRGSGMFGSITSRDVPTAGTAMAGAPSAPSHAHPAPKPAPGASYIDIPVTSMRATIAKRLTESKLTSPHVNITAQVNIDKLIAVRKKFNKAVEKQKVKISVNDFIIKAMALACKKVPEVNSQWMGTSIRQFSNVDVSVAVSTDRGLITPILHNADSIGLVSISKQVKELAEKARQNKLKPQEFQGGTITISNLGMFGVHVFSAVINPPQAAILAVGTNETKLVVDDNADRGFRETHVMNVTICCDHRVIDGAVAAMWLDAFREMIEDPHNMVLY